MDRTRPCSRLQPGQRDQRGFQKQLGCCEQFDQDAFAILLAWMTGLTDNPTYKKIKVTANRLQAAGPDTTERWEEQFGKSPSSIAAEIAGLVAAADIARQNGDTASATTWEVDSPFVAVNLTGWTFTTSGFWGGHQYYERIDKTSNPNDTSDPLCLQEGCFFGRDMPDFGFLISSGSACACPTTPTCRCRSRQLPRRRTATPRWR